MKLQFRLRTLMIVVTLLVVRWTPWAVDQLVANGVARFVEGLHNESL